MLELFPLCKKVMMTADNKDPLFGAAVLKLSFIKKGIHQEPGFRVVYHGTLKELKLTDSQVDRYIKKNKVRLDAHIDSINKN